MFTTLIRNGFLFVFGCHHIFRWNKITIVYGYYGLLGRMLKAFSSWSAFSNQKQEEDIFKCQLTKISL